MSEKHFPNPEIKEKQPPHTPDPKQVEKVGKGVGSTALRGGKSSR